jgi:predicted KAP-like P-loop ATPase
VKAGATLRGAVLKLKKKFAIMKTYKVSQERLDELKDLINTDLSKIDSVFEDEFNLMSDRLDHIDIKATQIMFVDRGIDFGDGVIDMTFRVVSK